jgi:hypothetical protein
MQASAGRWNGGGRVDGEVVPAQTIGGLALIIRWGYRTFSTDT